MKKILSTVICLSAVLVAFTACDDETETKVLSVPAVTLSPSSVTLSSEAVENYTINYTVSNPADGASVSATADASWVSGIDASVSGQVRFSVAENTSEDMRTANLTLTYSYDEGTVTAKAAVVQYGVGDPVLSVDPNAVIASAEGGTYSFGYTVENPLDGESVSCTTKADWISNFDYSTYGTVSFTVAATSEQDLRTGVITVSYAGLEKEVDVVQDRIGAPSVSVSPTRISASYEEGEYSFTYTLKNPVEGEFVSCTTDAEWITGITDDGDGTVTFKVGQNSEYESRTGTITVTYVGSEKNVTVEQEEFPGNWTLYGTGDYIYSVFWDDDEAGVGLSLYQNEDDKTYFKIVDWGYGVNFVFTWDEDTNEVVVKDHETGYTYSYYGMVSVDDVSDYYGVGQSFYEDGIFYFSVAYYIGGVGLWAVGCETFTLKDSSTAPTYTVDDLVGTYLLYGVSNFGSEYDSEEDWTFAESDDSSKGNIMLTNYNGWENADNPIYGTFDTSSGRITFDTGTDGIYIGSESPYSYYFVSYVAYYYQGMYGTEAYMTYLPNGSIIGPLEGDLICELTYMGGSPYSWNQAFECIAGPKNTEHPASLSASGKKELREGPVSGKVNRTPLKTSKLPFTKPAK